MYYDVTKPVTDSPLCSEDAERYHREETSLTAKQEAAFFPSAKGWAKGMDMKAKRREIFEKPIQCIVCILKCSNYYYKWHKGFGILRNIFNDKELLNL